MKPVGRMRGVLRIRKARCFYPLYGESHRTPRLKYFLPFLSGYQVEGRNPDNVGWDLSYWKENGFDGFITFVRVDSRIYSRDFAMCRPSLIPSAAESRAPSKPDDRMISTGSLGLAKPASLRFFLPSIVRMTDYAGTPSPVLYADALLSIT